MPLRLVAWVTPNDGPRMVRHVEGLPPAVTGDEDRRELLPWPRFVLLEERPDGVFILRFSDDGTCVGDTWHATMDDAKHQADYEYGALLSGWEAVPESVKDPVSFARARTKTG